ncbi:hypothetical protein ACTXT7_005129 [Hymenolepis weldensis]
MGQRRKINQRVRSIECYYKQSSTLLLRQRKEIETEHILFSTKLQKLRFHTLLMNSISGPGDEFVVPHMDVTCLTKSIAHWTMLLNPDMHLQNLHNLPPDAQDRVKQDCQRKLEEIQGRSPTENAERPALKGEDSPNGNQRPQDPIEKHLVEGKY